jgi:hypothetical protein
MSLPKRTADTMSDAISISSPNGRVSKRAKEAAVQRLANALFGDVRDLRGEPAKQPSLREMFLEQAARLRDLAARGMNRRAHTKEADRLEAEAEKLNICCIPAYVPHGDKGSS